MEVIFQRHINKNYMIVVGEDNKTDILYDYHMIENNSIIGLLPISIKQKDSHLEYYYEISSKQPLLRIFEKRKLNGAYIKGIMLSLGRLIKECSRFLLNVNNICLDPEYIYMKQEDSSVYFCYVTEVKKDITEGIKELVYFLMKQADHEDKEAVSIVYELFRCIMEENFVIDDLLQVLYVNVNVNIKEEYNNDDIERYLYKEEVTNNQLIEGEKEHRTVYSSKISNREGQEYDNENQAYNQLYNGENVIIDDIVDSIHKNQKKTIFHLLDNKLKSTLIVWFLSIAIIAFTIFIMLHIEPFYQYKYRIALAIISAITIIYYYKISKNKKVNLVNSEKKTKEQLYSREYELEEHFILKNGNKLVENERKEHESYGETTVLSEPSISHRLIKVDSLEEIKVSHFPFILGRGGVECDGILYSDQVSRIHFRIEEKEDILYGIDLNSTNGSWINNEPLVPNMPYKLKRNDRITIANLEYIFQ